MALPRGGIVRAASHGTLLILDLVTHRRPRIARCVAGDRLAQRGAAIKRVDRDPLPEAGLLPTVSPRTLKGPACHACAAHLAVHTSPCILCCCPPRTVHTSDRRYTRSHLGPFTPRVIDPPARCAGAIVAASAFYGRGFRSRPHVRRTTASPSFDSFGGRALRLSVTEARPMHIDTPVVTAACGPIARLSGPVP